MLVKLIVSEKNNKTLNDIYKEMINKYKSKKYYDKLYNRFIKDIFGEKSIKDFTSNDIDYFYMYLVKKTYNGHLYSQKYIKQIMNLLKNIFDYAIYKKYIKINLVQIKLYAQMKSLIDQNKKML